MWINHDKRFFWFLSYHSLFAARLLGLYSGPGSSWIPVRQAGITDRVLPCLSKPKPARALTQYSHDYKEREMMKWELGKRRGAATIFGTTRTTSRMNYNRCRLSDQVSYQVSGVVLAIASPAGQFVLSNLSSRKWGLHQTAKMAYHELVRGSIKSARIDF